MAHIPKGQHTKHESLIIYRENNEPFIRDIESCGDSVVPDGEIGRYVNGVFKTSEKERDTWDE